jgi:hypothetical protein
MLAERGLVLRRGDAADRRRTVLSLSAKGRRIHDRIEQVSRALERELLTVLTSAEREMLYLVLDKLERRSSDIFDAGDAWRAIVHRHDDRRIVERTKFERVADSEGTETALGRESCLGAVVRSTQQAFHHDSFMRLERTFDPVVTLALSLRQKPENLVVPWSRIPCEHVQKALDGFPNAILIASHCNLLPRSAPIKLCARLMNRKCRHFGSTKIRVLMPVRADSANGRTTTRPAVGAGTNCSIVSEVRGSHDFKPCICREPVTFRPCSVG